MGKALLIHTPQVGYATPAGRGAAEGQLQTDFVCADMGGHHKERSDKQPVRPLHPAEVQRGNPAARGERPCGESLKNQAGRYSDSRGTSVARSKRPVGEVAVGYIRTQRLGETVYNDEGFGMWVAQRVLAVLKIIDKPKR